MALTITLNGIKKMGNAFLPPASNGIGELALLTSDGEEVKAADTQDNPTGYSRAVVKNSSATGSSVTQLNMKVSDSQSTDNRLVLTNANDYYFSDALLSWGTIKYVQLYDGIGQSATLYYTGDLGANTVTVNQYNRLKIPTGALTITINFSNSGS